ncbi:MAG: hypothetical protein JWQ58_2642 [Reyranella sp.]|nr:hypothetical protein [Reyranella sp.]
MMVLKSIVLGLVMVLVATAGVAAQSWSEYRSVEGRYRIDMPGTPELETDPVEMEDQEVDMIQAIVTGPDATYLAAYMDFPTELLRGLPPHKVLENARDGAADGFTLRSDRTLTVAGSPAREYVIEQPEGVVLVMRIVLVGARLYQMVVVTIPPGGTADRPDTRRFIDSFALIP